MPGIISDGDLHFPYHDRRLEAAKIAFARDVKPDAWVNVGDAYDCYSLSRFEKEPAKVVMGEAQLQRELDSATAYWAAVVAVAKEAHFILGNHENRLSALIASHSGLSDLRSLSWTNLASLPPSVVVHPYQSKVRLRGACYEHGDKVGGRYGNKHPASWVVENRGPGVTIFGHTHRAEIKVRTVPCSDGRIVRHLAVNQGHGTDPSQHAYTREPNWQQGFCYVETWTEAGKQRLTPHLILPENGRFSFGGRHYDGRKSQ